MIVIIIVTIMMIWFNARKARRAGRAAGPLVFRKLGERTQWSLERDTQRRIVIHIFRCDDLVGRDAVFDPSIERRENVVRGIGRVRPISPLTERICPGPATAVSHS